MRAVYNEFDPFATSSPELESEAQFLRRIIHSVYQGVACGGRVRARGPKGWLKPKPIKEVYFGDKGWTLIPF